MGARRMRTRKISAENKGRARARPPPYRDAARVTLKEKALNAAWLMIWPGIARYARRCAATPYL